MFLGLMGEVGLNLMLSNQQYPRGKAVAQALTGQIVTPEVNLE